MWKTAADHELAKDNQRMRCRVHHRHGFYWILAILSLPVLPLNLSLAEETSSFEPPPLTVPPGFTVEIAAAPPLVKYPMMGCFDDRGRLFVAESHGKNLNKQELLEHRHRFIRMLEDTDNDGTFDKSTIFADKLVMPEGALWHRDTLYVLSSPYLWAFQDTNDDGVADVRRKLVGYMNFTGQANQHGAYLGPNGRLYFSGGHLGYDLKSSDGKPVAKGRAAAVFTCKTDGTELEVFGNGGINPVEVAFTAEGELFTTCPIFDSIGGRHDALIHWVRGSTAGPQDYAPPVLPQTGYRLPSVQRWGQVAPSGLMRYRSDVFGADYRDTFFATHFNTATVVNTRVTRRGSTFTGIDRNFLTSTSRDFHPTDVIEDADGSLLVIDTGGWFLISCPFSKVAKPEIQGAIYRIRRAGVESPQDPRGHHLDWANLREVVDGLDDARPAVRDRAIETLVARGSAALPAFDEFPSWPSAQKRRHAVWALSRIDTAGARSIIRTALTDSEPSVQQAAVRSAGILRDDQSVAALISLLDHDQWPLRRAAATALGQIGDPTAIPSLLDAIAADGDDHLRHSIIYALMEIKDFEQTVPGLSHPSPRSQHAALVALDEISAMSLEREQLLPLIDSTDPILKSTALKVLTSRTDWRDEMATQIDEWVRGKNEHLLAGPSALSAIGAFSNDDRVQASIKRALESPDTPASTRATIFRALPQLDPIPESWLSVIIHRLKHSDRQEQTIILATISNSTSRQFDKAVRQLAESNETEPSVALAAWSCLAENNISISDAGLSRILANLKPSTPHLARLSAARAIAGANLSNEQVNQLFEAAAQTRGTVLSILHDKLSQIVKVNGAQTSQQAKQLATIKKRVLTDNPSTQKQNQRISRLVSVLPAGDVEHGRALFFSDRATCSACHTVDGEGGIAGPDLSHIGMIRQRPDLLESILFPNSTIANSYETYTVVTTRGRTYQGIVRHAGTDWLVIMDQQRREIYLPRDELETLQRLPHSLMPQGLEANLSQAELGDLLAYLESLKPE